MKPGPKPTKTFQEHVQFRQLKIMIERRVKKVPYEERRLFLSKYRIVLSEKDYQGVLSYLRHSGWIR